MQFIEAVSDYYGEPLGHQVYINPRYIIKMRIVKEYINRSGVKIQEHYVILLETGGIPETLHITMANGNKFLKGE